MSRSLSPCVVVLLGLLLISSSEGRRLAQVAEAVLRGGPAASTSVGSIDDGSDGSQAAAYLRGQNMASAQSQLGFAVAAEAGDGASAAGDLIRRNAGYHGSSAAGEIFGDQDSGSASPAEDAIRRAHADSAAARARAEARMARPTSSPFDI